MCKVYTDYHGTSEKEHGLCACTVDNPEFFYLSVQAHKPCSISHIELSLVHSFCILPDSENIIKASFNRTTKTKTNIHNSGAYAILCLISSP